MAINDMKLVNTIKQSNDQIIERLIWLKALLIGNGICPDCGAKETMSDKEGQLWCAECDASYNYTTEVKKMRQLKEFTNDK